MAGFTCLRMQALRLGAKSRGTCLIGGQMNWALRPFVSTFHLSPGLADGCLVVSLHLSGWWCPAHWMSVFTCLPIHLSPMVVPDSTKFVCTCPLICLTVWVVAPGSPVWLLVSASLDRLSPFICLPSGRLAGCPSSLNFRAVSKPGYVVVLSSFDLRMSPNSMSPNRWYPALRMSIFTCLPSFVSWFCSWCPALWMSVFTCFPLCVSQAGWWCPALRMSLLTLSPPLRSCACLSLLVSVHLSPSVASGIRLSADVSLYLFCFIPKEIYCWKLGSSILSWEASSCLLVLVPGSLGDSLYLSPFICLPECLVVSGRMSLCTCFPLLLPVCLVRLGR